MDNVYLVCWWGGFETPSYALRKTFKEAQELCKEWSADLRSGDQIDILYLNLDHMTAEPEVSFGYDEDTRSAVEI